MNKKENLLNNVTAVQKEELLKHLITFMSAPNYLNTRTI